jgi:undecaprenyl phosphate-alpha-L-ara4N flippase subunit ArnE
MPESSNRLLRAKQMMAYVALAASIVIGVGGQVCLKLGAANAGGVGDQFLRWQTISGLLLYLVAGIVYVVAVRTIPVSIAFPSVSLSYVLMAGIDYFWFKEALGLAQLAGIALIIGGVTLLNH